MRHARVSSAYRKEQIVWQPDAQNKTSVPQTSVALAVTSTGALRLTVSGTSLLRAMHRDVLAHAVDTFQRGTHLPEGKVPRYIVIHFLSE